MSDLVERLRSYHTSNADVNEAADEIERLNGRVRELVAALDDQHGTPCEQIRHQQEIERLNALILTVSNNIASSPAKVLEESALVGKALDRLAIQDQEIGRLREENATLRNAQKACADCDAPTVAEIERLRGLLHHGIAIVDGDSPYTWGWWKQRVREALGDKEAA